MKTEVLKVTGMHCTSCEAMVKDTVSELEGISSVKPNFKKGAVEVKYDEARTTMEEIKAKIVEAGYKTE
jgi:copper chaperone CopZ